jgi:hypothetical protein
MRFRFWLPLIQSVAMLLVTWAPWAPQSHRVDAVLRDGREIKTWLLVPGPAALDFALGINLPAVPIVVPIEFAARRGQPWVSLNFRFFGFWLVGLLCWYMVGRLADDCLAWQRSGVLPKKNNGDVAFALLVVPSSMLLAGVFLFGGADPLVLAVWSAIWLVVSGSALTFRLLQVIRQRRSRPVS